MNTTVVEDRPRDIEVVNESLKVTEEDVRVDMLRAVSPSECLIVIPPFNFSTEINYDYQFPLGLAYIASTLKSAGHRVSCLNLNQLEGSIQELLSEKLKSSQYDYVLTGGNTIMFSLIKEITNTVRQYNSKIKVIIGGPIISSEPEVMFEYLEPDVAVVGEGEVTIIELLNQIAENGDLKDIAGLVYKENGETRVTAGRDSIKNIESIPNPNYADYGFAEMLDHVYCNDYYLYSIVDRPRVYPVLGSRGCPYACTFCWHHLKYAARGVDHLMAEIRHAVNTWKINFIFLYDDLFSYNEARLLEFCDRMKELSEENGEEVSWYCQLMVRTVSRPLLRKMRESGCIGISYGFESFSKTILKSMKKPITPEQIETVFKMTIEEKIAVQANFIFGDIAETEETFRETLEWGKKNALGQISFGEIRPYPGSPVYQYCVEQGLIQDKLEFILNMREAVQTVNMTQLSDEKRQEMRDEVLRVDRKEARIVTPLKVKKENRVDVYTVTAKCPFCDTTIDYGNCHISNHNRLTIPFLLPLRFLFNVICRNCRMKYWIGSVLDKLIHKNYPTIKPVMDAYIRLRKQQLLINE